MADLLYEPDCGTAFYRSRDNIKNLRVRVNLQRMTSASVVPQAEIEKEAAGQMEMKDLREKLKQNLGSQQDREGHDFGWQEKVFCTREIDVYSVQENCFSVLERKYNEDVGAVLAAGRTTKRLFSYVEHDTFTNQDENIKLMTTSPNETTTELAQKMSNVRYRRAPPNRDRDGGNSMIPKMNIVDYDPSEEKKKQNHLLSTPVTTMYIMADLSPTDRDATLEDEFVLCTIKVDTNGVMSIKPDFNKGRKPYKVDSAGQGRDNYEYTIEHVSSQLSRQEQDREHKMFRELYSRHTNYLQSLVGQNFEVPPLDVLRVTVFGEIESAKNFEYRDLYIQYFLDLPHGWMPSSGMPQQLLGVTQTCSTKVEERDEVAHFSFPFQCDLMYKRDTTNPEKDLLAKWPLLLIEVLSIDSWQRHRTEGYGYLTIPASPGAKTHEVHCWRPAGRSCSSELRRYFIGGSPQLEDLTYVGVPSTFEGSHLSKFGFSTISTGSVTLKLNILQQSQSFLQSASNKKKVGTIMDRIGHSQVHANILSVLQGFQRAKKMMIAARENLKQEFVETVKASEFGDDD